MDMGTLTYQTEQQRVVTEMLLRNDKNKIIAVTHEGGIVIEHTFRDRRFTFHYLILVNSDGTRRTFHEVHGRENFIPFGTRGESPG